MATLPSKPVTVAMIAMDVYGKQGRCFRALYRLTALRYKDDPIHLPSEQYKYRLLDLGITKALR